MCYQELRIRLVSIVVVNRWTAQLTGLDIIFGCVEFDIWNARLIRQIQGYLSSIVGGSYGSGWIFERKDAFICAFSLV